MVCVIKLLLHTFISINMSSLTVNTSARPASANENQVSTWRPTLRDNVSKAKPISYEKVNAVDDNGISVWIRFAFKNITPQRVFACLKKACLMEGTDPVFLGIILRIDEVSRHDGNKMFFVHFAPNSWGKNDKAIEALKNLIAGELRVYYDRQYFWKLSISSSKRPIEVDFPDKPLRSLPVPRMVSPELTSNYISAAQLVGGNELTFNPEEMEKSIRNECRDEMLKENGLKVTEDGEVVRDFSDD